MEIDRLERYQHPFTLAYIDLDNFKALNDQSGHLTGDKALRATVSFIRSHMRRTDVIARLGGDEFALLLPETNEELARIAVSKIQNGLLEEMQRNNWPITLSIGVLTCRVPPPSTDVLIKMADELMYSVKRQRKNGINYSTFAG
jgi:diguanylate cyclase (GGDEF)-like protein